MKYIPLAFVVIVIMSCVSQEKKEQNMISTKTIEKVYFSLASYGYVENPNELNDKVVTILIETKEISEIVSTYKNEKLSNKIVKKISKTPKKYIELIKKVPVSYLKNKTFGSPNMVDEGSLGVTLLLNSGERIFWEVSFNKNELPEVIQNIYEIYEEVQRKFKIKMNLRN